MSQDNGRTRVLHIAEDPMTVALILEPVLRRQREAGYDVEYACGSGEYWTVAEQMGVRGHRIPFHRGIVSHRHVRAFWHLVRLFQRERYDLVHSHTPMAGFLTRIAARVTRIPIVIHHMRGTPWGSNGGLKTALFNGLERLAGRYTDFMFTVNATDAAEVTRRGIMAADRVLSLGCGSGGLNTRRFDPQRVCASDQGVLREELGVEPGDLVIGFVGRMVRHKGVLELLDAFEIIVREGKNAKLLLVGGTLDSEQDQETERQFIDRVRESTRDIRERVIVTGFRSDIPELLSIMDVLVLPSHREGFGMVLAEAGAMGVPVIATATRGAREAIEAGKNGVLVPIGDAGAIAAELRKLLDDPERRLRMGFDGQRIAHERFSEDVIFQRVELEYRRLISEEQRAQAHL